MTVSLSYDSDGTRHLTNYAFLFLLLDESGNQVAVNPFYREAVDVDVPLTGRRPAYKPRLVVDPYCKQLTPGKRYQLICVLPSFGLAHSAWFTLVQ